MRDYDTGPERRYGTDTDRWVIDFGEPAPSQVRVQRLHPLAKLPQRQTEGAIGYDLYACLDTPIEVYPHHLGFRDAVRIPTGIAIAIPPGYGGEVRPRSSSLVRHGLHVASGSIDCDFRGGVSVAVINLGAQPVTICHGERIAQLVICPVVTPELVEGELDETVRGAGGFGSTGR